MKLFEDELHDDFGQWPVGYISAGGADMGDIIAVADAVGDGDDSAFYEAWVAAGDAKVADAETVLAAGHRRSARDLFRRFATAFGSAADEVADLDQLSDEIIAGMQGVIDTNRSMRWSIEQRGFWANDVTDLRGFISRTAQFTLKDRVGEIRCPTLLTAAENDPLAIDTAAFYDALSCPKELLRFTATEGAGGHCEMTNRSLLNRRVLDWLDETL